MEGATRQKLNFMDGLLKFHQQYGHPITRIPVVAGKYLDLYLLSKTVAAAGGWQLVDSKRLWTQVARSVHSNELAAQVAGTLRKHYLNLILPFEVYTLKVKLSEFVPPPNVITDPALENTEIMVSSDPGLMDGSSPLSSTFTGELSIISDQTDDDDDAVVDTKDADYDSEASSAEGSEDKRVTRNAGKPAQEPQSKRRKIDSMFPMLDQCLINSGKSHLNAKPHNFQSGEQCEVCFLDDQPDQILLCDECDLAFHMRCLSPPLSVIPSSEWFCSKCLSGKDDFGFDEGNQYLLHEFQDLAQVKKAQHIEQLRRHHNITTDTALGDTITAKDFESEFWSLAEDPYSNVEVEYGADLHTSIFGSGFPTSVTHPNNSYSSSPWNLNNLPVAKGSLLRYINQNISGMTIPWLYVGMCFSTFCWHTEDHHTYSINYLHGGDTKTWYGIPGDDALKFEQVMKNDMPELFEAQPDLLFHITTTMNPAKLVSQNVRVNLIHQRPGEFVVTFPRSYHSGFNQGFNVAEAVNFAPADWVYPHGSECVEMYRGYRKLPVFSHDQLLTLAVSEDKTVYGAQHYLVALNDFLQREQRCLDTTDLPQIEEPVPIALDQTQCSECLSFRYSSIVVCSACKKMSCYDHYSTACQCDNIRKYVSVRFSVQQIQDLITTVKARLERPNVVIAQIESFMNCDTRDFDELTKLLPLVQELDLRSPAVDAWKTFLSAVKQWKSDTQKLLNSRKSSRLSITLNKTTIDNGRELLDGLLSRAISLRLPEEQTAELKHTGLQVSEILHQVKEYALNPQPDALDNLLFLHSQMIENGLERWKETDFVRISIERIKWIREVQEFFRQKGHGTEYIRKLLAAATSIGIPDYNELAQELEEQLKMSSIWCRQRDLILNSKQPVSSAQLKLLLDSVGTCYLDDVELVSVRQKMTIIERISIGMESYNKCKRNVTSSNNISLEKANSILTFMRDSMVLVPESDTFIADVEAANGWLESVNMMLKCENATVPLRNLLERCQRIISAPAVTSSMQSCYCLCFSADGSGEMIACDTCNHWYHRECVNAPISTFENPNAKYFCPTCRIASTRNSPSYPSLSDLDRLRRQCPTDSHFNDNELAVLDLLLDKLMEWTFSAKKVIQDPSQHASVCHYLRQACGFRVDMDPYTSELRALLNTSQKRLEVVKVNNTKTCICRKQTSTTNATSPMICCDNCSTWYHMKCMRITIEEAESMETYICPACEV